MTILLIHESCSYCGAGFHFLCLDSLERGDLCCCGAQKDERVSESDPLNLQADKPKIGRPKKIVGVDSFENQLAAGRKRAEREFKIEPGTVCEWAWSRNCGGGIESVTGCSGRLARHIHHGPDKSTLNNDRRTNISLVCTFCHQLWHVRNDPYYEGTRPEGGISWLPFADGKPIHSLSEREPATADEIAEFEQSIRREMTPEDWKRINDRIDPDPSRSLVEGTGGRSVEDESLGGGIVHNL